MNLKISVLRGIYTSGFDKPSYLQQKVINPMIEGRDIIAESQSGTGKTAAFVISILQRIDETSQKDVQSLILTPTRELAQLIGTVIKSIGKYLNVRSQTFISGTSLKADIKCLLEGVQIVVGTPGRIMDLIQKKFLNLGSLKMFVLDEADEMLSRGYLKTVYSIQSHIPQGVQHAVFSETLKNSEILDLIDKYLDNPVKINLNSEKDEEKTVEDIRQFYLKTTKNSRLENLIHIYKTLEVSQTFIFCNNLNEVNSLSVELALKGFAVSSIHGGFTKSERDKQLTNFRSGLTRILVTSDHYSRGIDICSVELVINYDLPNSDEMYINRISRTSRFGRRGTAITFVDENSDESDRLQRIVKANNMDIEEFSLDRKV